LYVKQIIFYPYLLIETTAIPLYRSVRSGGRYRKPFNLTEASMSTLTIYLARLIGLSAVLLAAAILVPGNSLIMATVAEGPVMLVYAIISLAAGLAIILGHNVWSGGTLPVIVTLVGWLIFAKGLVLLLVTPEILAQLLERMQYGEHNSLYIVPALIIGLYLTCAGFAASSAHPKSV
jgi:hypothetical protein